MWPCLWLLGQPLNVGKDSVTKCVVASVLLVWSANPNERIENTVTYQCFCHMIILDYKSTMHSACIVYRYKTLHMSQEYTN